MIDELTNHQSSFIDCYFLSQNHHAISAMATRPVRFSNMLMRAARCRLPYAAKYNYATRR
jgi:hypothetical protein